MSELKNFKVWTYLLKGHKRPVKPSHVLCYTTNAFGKAVPFDVLAENGRKAKQIAARLRAEVEGEVDREKEDRARALEMSNEKEKRTVTIELVKGSGCGEGLYLDDNRIAGSKPMPGGRVTHSWEVDAAKLRKLLRKRAKGIA